MPASLKALREVASVHEGTRYRIKDQEKAQVFGAICAGVSTRREIAAAGSLRPTTVSRAVQELVADGLVLPGQERAPGRKGRPEAVLAPNPARYTAVAVHVVSRELRAALIDAGHRVLESARVAVPAEAPGERLQEVIGGLCHEMMRANPPGSELLGVGLGLPGTVNRLRWEWISAARWPRLRAVKLAPLIRAAGLRGHLSRALDSELEHLLALHPAARRGGTLLVHWGYGIGSAYAWEGKVVRSTLGRFGEIGHVTVERLRPRPCVCGQSGCLETEAALWALAPRLREAAPGAPEEEDRFSAFLRRHLGSLDLRRAVAAMTEGLAILHQLFYPDRLLLYGPFSEQAGLLAEVRESLLARIPEYARETVSLSSFSGSREAALFGSTAAFFRDALRQALTARWAG